MPRGARRLSPPVLHDDLVLRHAYDLHMRGVWYHNQQDQPGAFVTSIDLQRRAVALDLGLARAWMIPARSLYARALHGFGQDLNAADAA